MSKSATLSREQERRHLTQVITPEYRNRFPRRKIRPPAHLRALRLRRSVMLPNEQLSNLLSSAETHFPDAKRTYGIGELAITLFESRQFGESKRVMSPLQIEHLEGRVAERLKSVGGFAVAGAIINQNNPVDTYGTHRKPRVGLRILPQADLIEDARAVNDVIRKDLLLPDWNEDAFDPHISFAIANTARQGAEMRRFARELLWHEPIGEIIMNGALIENCLDESSE